MAEKRPDTAENRDAFAREAMLHLDHLYRVAVHLVKNSDDAGDLVQETYARALNSCGQFRPGTNMKAWLTRILYNFFFDQYRDRKRWVLPESDDATVWERSESLTDARSENPLPETHIWRLELGMKITAALKQIPEEFRAAVVLVDMGDFSYAEAAEILSCPVGTVRSRLSRARKLLCQRLEPYLSTGEKS